LCEGLRGFFDRRSLQEASCSLLRREQRVDFTLQIFVVSACVTQKRIALLRRAF
jgi:hypothetical protein